MSYSVMAINPGHNGSVALTVDGELKFYIEEERLSRLKYDGNPFRGMLQVLLNFNIDELVIGGTSNELPVLPWTLEDPYSALARKFNPQIKVTKMGHVHHLGHAASAFYGSGFDTAVAVVIDGAGSYVKKSVGEIEVGGFETESIYKCSYPNAFETLYKRYSGSSSSYYTDGVHEYDDSVTLTKAYEAVSDYLGFGFIEAGKTMGLSPYGENDPNIPKFFIEGKGNKNFLKPHYPAGAFIDSDRFSYLKRESSATVWHTDPSAITSVEKNIAFSVQREAESQLIDLVKRAIEISGETNVVISGGFGLNCVANFKLAKHFPGIQFYIDPVSHDGGTAIGLAKLAWHVHSNDEIPHPLTTAYLGTTPDYSHLTYIENTVENIEIIDSTHDQVASLLVDGAIVSLFQGLSEAGPRALGNRSILFDPRRSDGKDFVNQVKHREWFRPFAGSVLEEHSHDWFDLAGLEKSPYMMYAVDVRSEKIHHIPAITHIDGTCRIQTVSSSDNKHYYDLISAFYTKTGVPILFNTSFNLAGEPLVETIFDAVSTLIRSDIHYLYLPDVGKLIRKTV
jgi:carbamoyltransferase